jgi:uncharacterized protein
VDDARPEPEQRLAPAARVIWTLELGIGTAIALVVGTVVGRALRHHDHDGALHTLGQALPWAALVGGLVAMAVLPTLRARRWRWRLDDEELDLRHGAFTEIRTIIPVARIQHVDVRRTIWSQIAGTAAVAVHTAAGKTEIPILTEADAIAIRDRLAGLIQTPDDE